MKTKENGLTERKNIIYKRRRFILLDSLSFESVLSTAHSKCVNTIYTYTTHSTQNSRITQTWGGMDGSYTQYNIYTYIYKKRTNNILNEKRMKEKRQWMCVLHILPNGLTLWHTENRPSHSTAEITTQNVWTTEQNKVLRERETRAKRRRRRKKPKRNGKWRKRKEEQ